MRYRHSILDQAFEIFLCNLVSHGPVLIAAYCEKKLLCCDLEDTLISLIFCFVLFVIIFGIINLVVLGDSLQIHYCKLAIYLSYNFFLMILGEMK